MPAHVVLGVQWGDEGKGKIVDHLARGYDCVARYQGGANAGHTVVVGQDTFKLHLVPSGAVRGQRVALGNGVVIDPEALVGEIEGLRARGLRVRLDVSSRAHVVMPYHKRLDERNEKGRTAAGVGSTLRGIGPCYADKAARLGVRISDIVSAAQLRRRLDEVMPIKRKELKARGVTAIPSVQEMVRTVAAAGRTLAPRMRDVGHELTKILEHDGRVLLEGAQGLLLDIDHGTYPFVTSSNSGAGAAATGAGVAAHQMRAVLGVTKAYATRVGKGPFPTELSGRRGAGRQMVDKGAEVGTTTGRARRVGWLDVVALRYAVRVAGVTHLALTKLDVLDGLERVRAATSYMTGTSTTRIFPEDARDLERVKPVWRDLPGWSAAVGKKRALSKRAEAFVAWVERAANVPVVLVSVGPERSQTIVRKSNPFTRARRGGRARRGKRPAPRRT